jgi:hypothetical protein
VRRLRRDGKPDGVDEEVKRVVGAHQHLVRPGSNQFRLHLGVYLRQQLRGRRRAHRVLSREGGEERGEVEADVAEEMLHIIQLPHQPAPHSLDRLLLLEVAGLLVLSAQARALAVEYWGYRVGSEVVGEVVASDVALLEGVDVLQCRPTKTGAGLSRRTEELGEEVHCRARLQGEEDGDNVVLMSVYELLERAADKTEVDHVAPFGAAEDEDDEFDGEAVDVGAGEDFVGMSESNWD